MRHTLLLLGMGAALCGLLGHLQYPTRLVTFPLALPLVPVSLRFLPS